MSAAAKIAAVFRRRRRGGGSRVILPDADAQLHAATLDGLRTGLGATGYDAAPGWDTQFLFRGDSGLAVDCSTWTDAATGTVFTEAGSGASPVRTRAPFDAGYGAKYGNAGANRHDAPSAAFGDWAAENYAAFEVVFRHPPGAVTEMLVAKRNAGTSIGWSFYLVAGGALYFFFEGTLGSLNYNLGNITAGHFWHHGLMLFDRTSATGAVGYLNTVAAAAGDPTGKGSSSNALAMSIGAYAGGGNSVEFSDIIASVGMWFPAASPIAAGAAIVKERMARLDSKYLARHSDGAASRVPEVATRASSKHVLRREDDGESRYYNLGNNWLGTGRQVNAAGTHVAAGYDCRAQATQQLANPNAIASWTKDDVSMGATNNALADPAQGTTAGQLVEGTHTGYHRISAVATLTGTTYQIQAWMAKQSAARAWYYVQRGTHSAYFNLSAGAKGTILGSGVTSEISPAIGPSGTPGYIIVMRGASTGAQSFYIGIADADSSPSFAGDPGTYGDGVAIWCANAFSDAKSINPPQATAATRAGDALRYALPSSMADNQQGSIVAECMAPAQVVTVNNYVTGITDGGSVNDRLALVTDAAAGSDGVIFAAWTGGGAQWAVTGTTDIADGEVHTVRCKWRIDDAQIYVDGSSEGTPDTSGTPPQGQDRWDIGHWGAGGNYQLGGLIARVSVSKSPNYTRAAYQPEEV